MAESGTRGPCYHAPASAPVYCDGPGDSCISKLVSLGRTCSSLWSRCSGLWQPGSIWKPSTWRPSLRPWAGLYTRPCLRPCLWPSPWGHGRRYGWRHGWNWRYAGSGRSRFAGWIGVAWLQLKLCDMPQVGRNLRLAGRCRTVVQPCFTGPSSATLGITQA